MLSQRKMLDSFDDQNFTHLKALDITTITTTYSSNRIVCVS